MPKTIAYYIHYQNLIGLKILILNHLSPTLSKGEGDSLIP